MDILDLSLQITRDIHSHYSKNSYYNFQVPNIYSLTSTTFYYIVSKEWNSLPKDLREIENKAHVKQELKKYLYIRAEQRSALTSVFY